MKNILKKLGYSHVNHFITAFGKQFGYSWQFEEKSLYLRVYNEKACKSLYFQQTV